MNSRDILMKTEVHNHVVFLLHSDGSVRLEMITRQVNQQFERISVWLCALPSAIKEA